MEVVDHGGGGGPWRWWTVKVLYTCNSSEGIGEGGGGGPWRWWTMEVVVDHEGGGPWRW